MITLIIGGLPEKAPKGRFIAVLDKIFDPQRIKALKAHFGAKRVILRGYTIPGV